MPHSTSEYAFPFFLDFSLFFFFSFLLFPFFISSRTPRIKTWPGRGWMRSGCRRRSALRHHVSNTAVPQPVVPRFPACLSIPLGLSTHSILKRPSLHGCPKHAPSGANLHPVALLSANILSRAASCFPSQLVAPLSLLPPQCMQEACMVDHSRHAPPSLHFLFPREAGPPALQAAPLRRGERGGQQPLPVEPSPFVVPNTPHQPVAQAFRRVVTR